jgi:hypothetical protein
VIPEDRKLLAELARLNGDMAPLALRIMDGSASSAEQQNYAQRLIAAGEQLKQRTAWTGGVVVEGVVLDEQPIAIADRTIEPGWEP